MLVVFVHGVGNRKDRFDEQLARVRKGVGGRWPEAQVEGVYWGDLGASTDWLGKSLPEAASGRGDPIDPFAGTADQADWTWALLEDPYLELRALREHEGLDPFVRPTVAVAERNQELRGAVDALADQIAAESPSFTAGAAIGHDVVLHVVRHAVEEASGADPALGVPELIGPLQRCLTAALCVETLGDDDALDADFRWNHATARILELLERQLGGARALGPALWAPPLTFTLRHGLRRRVLRRMSVFVGDVLAYLARRETVQARVAEAVASRRVDGPLWLVGHSLGGVIAFDYCRRVDHEIGRLVTVGSQVGLFGELAVFDDVARDADGRLRGPERINVWRNLYDPDDFLSFLAAPVFTGVVDVAVDTRAPFPISHSEYWNQPCTYASL
jgi:hypothetical protein